MSDTVQVAHSTPLPAAIRELVQQRYAVGIGNSCQLQRAYTNDVFRLETRTDVLFFKVARMFWRDIDNIQWETSLVNYLADAGLHVSAPLPTVSGEFVTILELPEGRRAGTLTRRLPGARPRRPFPPALYERVGELAAKLHMEMDTFRHPCPRPARTPGWLIGRSMTIIRTRLGAAHDAITWLDPFAWHLEHDLRNAGTDLDWGLCHGDLTLDNVVVDADGYLGVFDFDLATVGFRAAEGVGVFTWAFEEPDAHPYWSEYVAGYRRLRAFPEAAQTSVPLLAAADAIWTLAHLIEHWDRWSGLWTTSPDAIDDQLSRIRRWIRD